MAETVFPWEPPTVAAGGGGEQTSRAKTTPQHCTHNTGRKTPNPYTRTSTVLQGPFPRYDDEESLFFSVVVAAAVSVLGGGVRDVVPVSYLVEE